MSDNKKMFKKDSVQNNQNNQNGQCPEKDGDNCTAPGVYSDSDPIGGG